MKKRVPGSGVLFDPRPRDTSCTAYPVLGCVLVLLPTARLCSLRYRTVTTIRFLSSLAVPGIYQ
jgi:hypothetical protein